MSFSNTVPILCVFFALKKNHVQNLEVSDLVLLSGL